jgi:hypothetical protein
MEYVLDITQEYKYLGVLFKSSGSFTKSNIHKTGYFYVVNCNGITYAIK